MSHDLTDTNGKTEFAYLDTVTPWHGLGTVMSSDEFWSLDEFMVQAGLDWTVSKEQLVTNESKVKAPDMFGLVRQDTLTVLGTTGKRYEVFPHRVGLEEIAKYGTVQTMGSLSGGKVVFGCVELDQITVGPETIKRFLTAAMGHDGATDVSIFNSDVCTVCRNTLDAGFASAGRKWSARHTENISSRFKVVEEELADLFSGNSAQRIMDEIDHMLNTEISDQVVQDTLEQVWPKKGNGLSTEAWAVRGLYEQHPTIRDRNGEDIHGTEWGLYQAVSFYDLWSKEIRGDRLERQAYSMLDDNPTPNARKVKGLLSIR